MHQSLFIPFNLTYIILGNLILRNFQHLSFRFGSYTPTHNHTIIFSKLANKSCISVPFLKHATISVWDCELEWNFHLCRVSLQKHWQIDHKHFFLQDKWMKTFTNLIARHWPFTVKLPFKKGLKRNEEPLGLFFLSNCLSSWAKGWAYAFFIYFQDF